MKLTNIIGQLFVIGFQGETISAAQAIAEDISRRNLGGVILFDRFLAGKQPSNNIISPAQLQLLNSDLQRLAETRLLICIDQEGGKVCRLKEAYGFPSSAAAQDIGDNPDPGFALAQADLVASTLAGNGINFNFAPDADLNSNPDNPIIGGLQRSFSADAKRVVELSEIWLDCHRKNGILSCLKHFPGHGSSKDDSHLGFVNITDSWQVEELIPYRELIYRNKVDAVMIGHLFHSGLDRQLPASLSPAVIQDILRRDLHFEGVVVTDDIQMKAITDRYGLREAIILALSAGVDLIVIGNNLIYDADILQKAIAWIEDAVRCGDLSMNAVMDAYARVQRLKQKLLH